MSFVHLTYSLNLIDSFNLAQSVTEPTHKHVLDLILTSGITASTVQINNSGLSDHWPIMFSTSFLCKTPKSSQLRNYARSITPITVCQFSDALSSAVIIEAVPADCGTEEQVKHF